MSLEKFHHLSFVRACTLTWQTLHPIPKLSPIPKQPPLPKDGSWATQKGIAGLPVTMGIEIMKYIIGRVPSFKLFSFI